MGRQQPVVPAGEGMPLAQETGRDDSRRSMLRAPQDAERGNGYDGN
jgi:hypothetical protein